MCIRDRLRRADTRRRGVAACEGPALRTGAIDGYREVDVEACLLYTSDAADDLLCVDLGGRRIIKKKNQ